MRHTKRRPTTLPLGTISEATLRTDDLVDALIDALAPLRLSRADRATVREAQRALQAYHDAGDDAADDDADGPVEALDLALDDLAAMADEYAPDYAYYGTLEGDGACFGVWPSLDSLADDDRVDRGSDYRSAGPYATHYAEVNDHGNVTLYRRAGRRWIEVWSVV